MAYLIQKEREELGPGVFVETRIYAVPMAEFFPEGVKYSLSLVKDGICVLRYDNERTKGHHRHAGGHESKLEFTDIQRLRKNFMEEARKVLEGLG